MSLLCCICYARSAGCALLMHLVMSPAGCTLHGRIAMCLLAFCAGLTSHSCGRHLAPRPCCAWTFACLLHACGAHETNCSDKDGGVPWSADCIKCMLDFFSLRPHCTCAHKQAECALTCRAKPWACILPAVCARRWLFRLVCWACSEAALS